MKKLVTVGGVAAVLAVVGAVAAIAFVESETFGRIAAGHITTHASDRLGVQVKVAHLRVRVHGASLEMEGVEVALDGGRRIAADRVHVAFSPGAVLRGRAIFPEIAISGAVVAPGAGLASLSLRDVELSRPAGPGLRLGPIVVAGAPPLHAGKGPPAQAAAAVTFSSLSIAGGRLGGEGADSVYLADLTMTVTRAGGDWLVSAKVGRARLPLGDLVIRDAVIVVEGVADAARIRLGELSASAGEGARLSFSGAVTPSPGRPSGEASIEGAFSAAVPMPLISRSSGSLPFLGGALAAKGTVKGAAAAPVLQGALTIARLALGEPLVGDAVLGDARGKVTLDADARTLDARVVFDDVRYEVLAPYAGHPIPGRGPLDVALAGPLAAPRMTVSAMGHEIPLRAKWTAPGTLLK